jgi:hypothetical protein
VRGGRGLWSADEEVRAETLAYLKPLRDAANDALERYQEVHGIKD